MPELRFKGFSDAWVQRKLGDLGKTKSGIGFPDTQQGGAEGTPFYKVSDMNNPGNEVIMTNANNYVSESQLVDNKWKTINPENSGVVFAKVGAAIFLDRKRIVDNPFLIDNNMMSYLFDSSWNRYFGKTLFEKLRLARFAQVGALPSFNGSDVEDIKVTVPETSEQAMIGKLFEQLENLIAANQRKIDDLKALKNAYLERIFTQSLRFSGYTEPWVQRKFFDNVKNVIDFRGRTPLKLGMDWSDSGYLALSALNVKNGYIDANRDAHYGGEELYQKWMGNVKLVKGDVLFTTEAPMGNVAQVPDDKGYILSQRTIALQTDEDVTDSTFFAQYLRSPQIQNTLNSVSSGGTAKGVSQKTLTPIRTVVPGNVREQKKIGEILVAMDNLITANQKKIDLMQKQKQAYLQKMFI